MTDENGWPIIAPVAIILIRRGEELLLAKGLPPKKHYSCIAGHVEPNESVEDCAHREVKEEIDVEIENLQYFGSQPWPHPNKLMIAYIADYKSGEIKIDEKELTDAKWFTKDSPPEVLPAEGSIARLMIDSVWT